MKRCVKLMAAFGLMVLAMVFSCLPASQAQAVSEAETSAVFLSDINESIYYYIDGEIDEEVEEIQVSLSEHVNDIEYSASDWGEIYLELQSEVPVKEDLKMTIRAGAYTRVVDIHVMDKETEEQVVFAGEQAEVRLKTLYPQYQWSFEPESNEVLTLSEDGIIQAGDIADRSYCTAYYSKDGVEQGEIYFVIAVSNPHMYSGYNQSVVRADGSEYYVDYVTGYYDTESKISVTVKEKSGLQAKLYNNEDLYVTAKEPGLYHLTITADGKEIPYEIWAVDTNPDALQMKKGKTLELSEIPVLKDKPAGTTISYSTYDTDIIQLNEFTGTVKSLKYGEADVEIIISLGDDTLYFYVTISVSNPKISVSSVGLNLYGLSKGDDGYYYPNYNYFVIKGINSSTPVKVKSNSSKLKVEYCYYSYDEEGWVYLYPKKTGTYKVTVSIGDYSKTITVNVSKMYFSLNKYSLVQEGKKWNQYDSCILLARGEKTELKVNNAPDKVKFTSSDKTVATVSSKGVVTAKGDGDAVITATCGGASISYNLQVSGKTNVKAVRYAVKVYGATYSQEKRMSKGYYDCSSYVWRSYADAGLYLGNRYYAPTAADLAKWCADQGYIIAEVDSLNYWALQPGDLVFSTGSDNGRYRGIYHVDLYQGNGTCLSVNRMKWGYYGSGPALVARVTNRNPVGLKATSKTSGQVALTWNMTHGANGYQVYRSDGGSYKKVATVKNGKLTWTDKKAVSGKTYTYKIRAYYKTNKTRYSPYSSTVKIKCK